MVTRPDCSVYRPRNATEIDFCIGVMMLFIVVHFPALIKRYVLGKFASSQIKLNQLWAPPRMSLGSLYAETFRTLPMGGFGGGHTPIDLVLGVLTTGTEIATSISRAVCAFDHPLCVVFLLPGVTVYHLLAFSQGLVCPHRWC